MAKGGSRTNDAPDRLERLSAAGSWLRSQRQLRGWSGTELAGLLGVNQVRVSAYERGQYEVPAEMAEKIAMLFNEPVIDVRDRLGLWVPDQNQIEQMRGRPDASKLPDESLVAEFVKRYQRQSDRQIVEVFPQRSAIPGSLWDRLIDQASSTMFFGGYTNYFFWTERPDFGRRVAEKARQGIDVRFLVGDPASPVTSDRENVEQVALSLGTRISITLTALAETPGLGRVAVRMSQVGAESHVARSIFCFDDEMIVTEHIAAAMGNESLSFHIRRTDTVGAFDRYRAHLGYLWDGGCPALPVAR